MDSNEINLDELDKSDISSDWSSSEDEAPVMEVEEDNRENGELNTDKMEYEDEQDIITAMASDDEPAVIPHTEHEILAPDIEVEEINVTLDSSALLVNVGVVTHVLEDYGIVDAGKNSKAVEEGTILFRRNMKPIGRVMEVFGQVEHPFYVVRWPKNMENPYYQVGEVFQVNHSTIQYILPAQLCAVGTDASNIYDEEPNEKERILIECTEDVKGEEIIDESEMNQEDVDYNRDYVIPSGSDKAGNFHAPTNMMTPSIFVSANYFNDSTYAVCPTMQLYPMQFQMPAQTAPPRDANSGLDVLKNSYF